jgi:hypothetical protein
MRGTELMALSRVLAWAASHKSLVTTAGSGTVIAALIATVAIVSTGYSAQKVQLDDGAVWVTSDLHEAAGRANPAVGELNAALRMDSGSLGVAQLGQTVVVTDLGGGEGRIIDTASAAVSDTFPLPTGQAAVSLTAATALIVSRTTGDVWVLPPGSLATFDPSSTPDLTLGAGGDAVIAPGGTVFAVSAATGSVFELDPGASSGQAKQWPVAVATGDDVSITAAGSTWAVLDRTSGVLATPSSTIPLHEQLAGTDDSWLQAPSSDPSSVLVATPTSLYGVQTGDGSVDTLSNGHTGASVSPTAAGGCVYAAWTDGSSWSRCGADAPADGTLGGLSSGADLEFRENGTGGLLLSDAVTGRAWDVTRGNAVIDNWSDLLPDAPTDDQSQQQVSDDQAALDPTQRPPVAVDDDLGARPGRSSVLPVLLNDYDPNGDVVVIDDVRVPDGVDWSVQLIANDQQLQLTLPPSESGTLSFGYTISDGRGGTADATVHVAVRSPGENSPPVQSKKQTLHVAVGGRAVTNVQGDWYDPDGDAFYIQEASVPAPDVVTYTPDGSVTFTDGGQAPGTKEIAVTVSDGTASSVGSIGLDVRAAPDVPLVAEGFVVQAHVGEEVQISPLDHVRGGSTALRLANVPAHDGYAIAPDYAGGTIRITAQSVGTDYLDYAVADGSKTASGSIRIDVTQAPDANARPVTTPHAVFARLGTSVLVDVLATDYDPAGGVLIVSGTGGVMPSSGMRVEVIDQRIIRVTLTEPLTTGTASFGYTVTNGLADAQGSVTVIEIPEPAHRQPPIAVPDTASVRVGDVVDIPVLANDVQPDGDPLTLDPDLVKDPGTGSGLLFASGSDLRYLAPDTPGDFTAVYRVNAPDGQWATAQVSISVREADPTANSAPVPQQITARVIAGETVRIPIPLTGLDPDGDSVQFLGADSVPDKGIVTQTGADWLEYQAGDYSAGTDSFTYTVIDRLGARATGTIRVGISPRQDGARNPVATPDEVLVRPGKTLAVRVLDNDSDPDGSPLTITSVTPTGTGATASIVNGLVSVAAIDTPGRYGFIYEIADSRGGTSSTFLTVDVSADAPLARPQVSDTVLSLTDILDKTSIDVNVLSNVFFAEGPASDLWLSVQPAFSSVAQVTSDDRVRVKILPQRQVIPFTVAHPDDPNIRSSGFIWVPGTDDALPQLKTGAPGLTVQSGATLRIALNDYVVAVGGRTVRIADPNTVRATHADGSSLVDGSSTLVFRSADGYYGPASMSFEVADGDGPSAHTATLVLPITVTPRQNQPPVFGGASIDFEPGQQKVIDLGKLTTYPYADARDQLAYQVLDPKPAGFSYSLNGSTLTITADVAAKKGTQGSFSIAVRDNANPGSGGRIDMTIVPSTKPLAIPATDTVVAPRGQTTTVDVLANDAATNPFPQTPLVVSAVRGIDSGSLPAGITIVPSADKSTLQVSVAADAAPTDVSVQYQVLDATGDPDRAAWGTVRISVLDRPAPVSGVAVTGFGDRTLTVGFSPGSSNNSPITAFVVTASRASGASTSTDCSSTSCVVPTPGNGPANAVTVSVAARNAVGLSDAVTYATPVWSDILPSAPGNLVLNPRDGAVGVSWSASQVAGAGTPVQQYEVRANGALVETVDASGAECTASGCSTSVTGLQNGSSVSITVTAKNGAFPALAVWPATGPASTTPYGAPKASTVSAAAQDDGSGGRSVQVAWPGFDGNGNAVAGYFVQRLAQGATGVPTGAQACSVSPSGVLSPPTAGGDVAEQQQTSGTSAVFGDLDPSNPDYSFVVWGYNAGGCTASAVVTASVFPAPDAPTAGDVALRMTQTGTTVDVRVTVTPPSSSARHYEIRQVNASGTPVSAPVSFSGDGYPRTLTGGSFGETYRFIIQACNVWAGTDVCSPYSAAFAAPEPSLTFDMNPAPVYAAGGWAWTNAPQNGSLTASFTCGTRETDPADATHASGANTCASPGVAPGDAALNVTIGEWSYQYRG